MKHLNLLAIAALVILSACQKDAEQSPHSTTDLTELNVPAAFDWVTTEVVSVNLPAQSQTAELATVQIYDQSDNQLLTRKLDVSLPHRLEVTVPKGSSTLKLIVDGRKSEVRIANQEGTLVNKKSFTCPCDGRMRNLVVVYQGNNGATVQAFTKKYKPTHSFSGVQNGDTLNFAGFDKHGRLESQTLLYDGGLYYNIHTSCSIDVIGLTFGNFYIIGYTDGQGAVCGLPPTSCPDADGDGCCDALDAFPQDPSKCDAVYVPAEDVYATVAFEDLWPYTGDFDFNDKVIDRNTIYSLNADGKVSELDYTIVLRAAGASKNNGFGFSLPQVPASAVASVTGNMNNPQNYTSLAASGVEAGQSSAVVIVYENWKSIATKTNNGAYFNTVPGGGAGTADTMRVKIVFSTPQDVAAIEWDPFLIRDGNKRGMEIHLPAFGPTDLADMSKLGTGLDASAYPSSGNNYVTANNIPWAIETPLGSYQYVQEYLDITTVYYYFTAWSMSGGALYPDWYLDLPGYRDDAKLY